MPRGKTHENVALISLLPTFIVGCFIFKDPGPAAMLTLATLAGALFLSPDLDTKSLAYYRWGIIRFIWIPYRKLIPHRSRLSHSLISGPILKIAYLLILLLIITVPLFIITGPGLSYMPCIVNRSIEQLLSISSIYLFSIILGIFWANTQHILLDYANTLFKRLRSKA